MGGIYLSFLLVMTDVFNWSLNRAYVAFLLHHVVLVFAIILSRQTGWTGGRLNKKDGLTRYGDSHVKDKTS